MLDPGSLAESQARERAEGDERPEPLVGHGHELPVLVVGWARHRSVRASSAGETCAVGRGRNDVPGNDAIVDKRAVRIRRVTGLLRGARPDAPRAAPQPR